MLANAVRTAAVFCRRRFFLFLVMLGFLAELAHVLTILAPAAAAFLTVFGVGFGVYEAVHALDSGGVLSFTHYIISAVDSLLDFTSELGSNTSFFNSLLNCVALKTALRLACNFLLVVYTVLTGVIALFGFVGAGLAGVYVYQKTKFLCNILSARGAIE